MTYQVKHIDGTGPIHRQATTVATGLTGDEAQMYRQQLKGQLPRGSADHYEVHPDK